MCCVVLYGQSASLHRAATPTHVLNFGEKRTFGVLAEVDVHGGEFVGLGQVLEEDAHHPPDLVLHGPAQPRLDEDARARGGREGHGDQHLGVVLQARAEGGLGPGCVWMWVDVCVVSCWEGGTGEALLVGRWIDHVHAQQSSTHTRTALHARTVVEDELAHRVDLDVARRRRHDLPFILRLRRLPALALLHPDRQVAGVPARGRHGALRLLQAPEPLVLQEGRVVGAQQPVPGCPRDLVHLRVRLDRQKVLRLWLQRTAAAAAAAAAAGRPGG